MKNYSNETETPYEIIEKKLRRLFKQIDNREITHGRFAIKFLDIIGEIQRDKDLSIEGWEGEYRNHICPKCNFKYKKWE